MNFLQTASYLKIDKDVFDKKLRNVERKIMKFVDPKVDSAFKLLFGMPSNKDLVKDFLNVILKLEEGQLITEIEFFGNEISSAMPNFDGNKVFIDIHCLDQKNHHYIIEMQVENQHNFVPRMLYYGARALGLQKIKRGSYQVLLPVIVIGIVNYRLLNQEQNVSVDPISKYVFKHAQNNQILPNSVFDCYFVELPKFTKKLEELETQLDRWLYFLQNADDLTFIPDQLKSLKKAFEVLNEVMWSREDLARYRKEEEDLGKMDRIEEGARKEGAFEAKEEMALKLLNKKMAIEEIAELTGLSVDQVEILKAGQK